MSARHLSAAAAVTLLGVFGPATPAAAHVLVQPTAAGAFTLTAGRLWSVVAALLGLAGLVIGGLAMARSVRRARTGTGTGTERTWAFAALAAGLAGAAIGALVVAAADGGPGTGYGIVGGFIALVIGLIATLLGTLALVSTRRTTSPAGSGSD